MREIQLRYRGDGGVSLPIITGLPIILGVSQVGTAMNFARAFASGGSLTHTQQWALDGVDITGATNSTYTPLSTDAGHRLTLRQIETNTAGSANVTTLNNIVRVAGSVVYGATADAGQVDTGGSYSGNIYYFDPVSGSDTNTGLSTSQAWQTVAKLQSAVGASGVIAGSAILFKRGTTMLGAATVQNTGPGGYTFGAYGTGARPILRYDGTNPTAQHTVLFHNKAGARMVVRNMQIDGNTITDSGSNYVTGIAAATNLGFDVINCNIINCPGNGITLSGTNTTSNLITNNFVTACCSVQANGAGIDGGAPSGSVNPSANAVEISYNTVDSCGNGITSHSMYISVTSNSAIHNNWCKNASGNLGINMHGLCDTINIFDNKIDCPSASQNGIGVTNGGYVAPEGFSNYIIDRNIINGGGTGIALEGMTSSFVTNNVVNGATVYGAYLITSASAPSHIPYPANIGFFNNTLYATGSTAHALRFNGANWTANVFFSNVLYDDGTSGLTLDKSTTTVDSTFTLNNDQHYSPNNPSYISWGVTAYTLATFQAAVTGKETAGQYGNPLFTTLGSDFSLQGTSPCKTKAAPLGLGYDFAGNARSATAPSIGAYE